MDHRRYEIEVTFTEPLLGTVPKDPEVYKTYIQSKAADLGDEAAAEELATVESAEEKGWTGFHVIEGKPHLHERHVYGFLKDACGMLRRVTGSESKKLKAYKKVIDGLVFVEPRWMPLVEPDGETDDAYVKADIRAGEERPLRAQTAQGERVTLARSDVLPPGTKFSFVVEILGGDVTEKMLREWLDYGAKRGFCQWRNAGYGRFTHEMTKL